ncbi:hydantoinase/carbamoylase family amidase [Falsiroseomonas sp. E2-1-a20]|uniref:hydantoinase/carbamoylase family amidase n=1 Tax=Falsiroseomonas sp. E2-1-a20 TaxID=3239300 RepID=UPI003F339D49
MAADPRTTALADAVAAQRDLASGFFDELRAGTSDGPGVTRAAYGEGEAFAHDLLVRHAAALGLEVSRDAALNTYLTWPGRDRALPALMVGSHLDSVPQGGNFDGAAGVVAGLAAIAALKRLPGAQPACDIILMAIRAEESIWFQVSYIGSRAALGTLPPSALQACRTDTGRTLAEHITQLGGRPAALLGAPPFLPPGRIGGFIELHIEQAPSLVEAGLPVAVGTGIPGNFRYPAARIQGEQGHVGLPRRFRRDAALAAAEFAVGLDRIWQQYDADGIPMACTIGRFHTDARHHGLTIVPGSFDFSLDIRAYDEATLARLEDSMKTLVTEVEAHRGVSFELGARTSAPVGPVDPVIRASLEGAAQALGLPWRPLESPASHDAAAFAAAGITMGLIFVRNANGSHNPAEAMEIDDLLAGTAILAHWLRDAAGMCSVSGA